MASPPKATGAVCGVLFAPCCCEAFNKRCAQCFSYIGTALARGLLALASRAQRGVQSPLLADSLGQDGAETWGTYLFAGRGTAGR